MKSAPGIDPLVSMRSEIISLGLDEIGGQPCASETIIVRQSRHKAGSRQPGIGKGLYDGAELILVLNGHFGDMRFVEEVRDIVAGGEQFVNIFHDP